MDLNQRVGLPCFFYGTLMVPSVLQRVLARPISDLKQSPAILPGYIRLGVVDKDYPGVIGNKSATVQGALVWNLTAKDLKILDEFEDDEYSVTTAKCKVLETGEIVDASVYVWTASLSLLTDSVWDYDHFMAEKSALWSADGPVYPDGHSAFPRVEAAIGSLLISEKESSKEDYTFGHEMLRYWAFKPGYVNLNHGSYGSVPKPVMTYTRALSDQCEENPDLFMRRSYLPLLTCVRQKLATFLNTKLDNCVLVSNATMAINTVTLNLKWEEGDVILAYSTSYGAILQTLRATCDRNPGVSLEIIPITFPVSHEYIIEETRKAILANPKVKVCVIDGIASNPGMVFPWIELSRLCKEHNVISIVDGAHLIGQLPLNMGPLEEEGIVDYFVANCHKWMMSHRGGAVLWVPERNYKYIRTSIPTSFDYESEKYPNTGRGPWDFARQFQWVGTVDWMPFLSISAAMDFRQTIGGETKIINYTHDLAVSGGARLSQLFGNSAIMENEEGTLTASMVNVAIPEIPAPANAIEGAAHLRFFENCLFESGTFAAVYMHGGKWWVRASAQVWNELSDFDSVAKVIISACDDIRSGAWQSKFP